MIKKNLLLLTILVFLVTAGFGCKGLSSEEKSVIKKVTVNYWTVFDDVAQLEKFAQEYEQIRTPGAL